MVWHFSIAIGLAILFCAAAYFSPIGKKFFIACAAICVALVVGEGIGVNMGKARCDAQAAEVTKFVKGVVTGTTTKKSRGAADPWDSPNN